MSTDESGSDRCAKPLPERPGLRRIPAPDRKPCCRLTRRKAVVLLGLVIAVMLLSLLAQEAKRRDKAMKPPPVRVDFVEAVPATVGELDDALHLYVMFFAIRHDGWLASEASMVTTSIELTGLPVTERAEDLLDCFPGVKKEIGEDLIQIHLLDSPDVDMMEAGVVFYPKEGRVSLLQGRMYTQDGYGGLIRRLEGAAACQFTVDLRFLPGDYDDPGDFDDYRISLAGRLEGGGGAVRSAGGNVATPEKVKALIAAAAVFQQVSSKETYRFESDAEAGRVQALARRVAADVSGIDIRRTADGYIARDNIIDVAILLCYERYGETVFGAD